MRRCDVLVVGGGPGGSTCAWRLRRAGLDVVVVDKKAFPRDKVCAGWITPPVVDALELDVDDYRRARVFQPIHALRTGLIGAPQVHTEYGRTVSYGIRRCELDHYLLRRSGAELVAPEPLRSLERRDGAWTVNGHLQAPVVVGAGGHFCPVARHIGARVGGSERVVAAHELEFVMDREAAARCTVAADTPELFFCGDLLGYGWVFRKGDVLNVGLGREDNHQLARHVEAFCRGLRADGKLPGELPGRFKGHAYLLYGHAGRALLDDGVLLVGDAAGLAYTQSGEGIRPAVESALLAAETIIAAQGDYRRERLAPYAEALTARLGPRENGTAAAHWLPRGLKERMAAGLMRSRWFARHVVLDRWFLHADLPPLEAA